MNHQTVDPQIAAASQRLAGISALHKIRQIVDVEVAQEQTKSRWAKRVSVFAVVGIIVAVGWAANAILQY